MNTSKEPFLSAILSFLFPGAGQIYNGDVGKGIAWFFGVIIGYIALVVPGLIAHGFCIYKAYTRAIEINSGLGELPQVGQQKALSGARRLDVQEFVMQLEKTGQLHESGILSDEEYRTRKSELISSLGGKEMHGTAEDFLLSVSPLRETGILTEAEMARIKSMVL